LRVADYIGVIGLALILAGWAWEISVSIRSKRAGVPLQFALLYGSGSLLLTLHSVETGDIVFIVLNAAATLVAMANAFFAFTRKNKKGAPRAPVAPGARIRL
jgi:lipid-A-disaccharide synthase-like uncharacterized protein